MHPVRTAARALIIFEEKLLTVKMRSQAGVFYILPGGGQQHGETLRESLVRECMEEVGSQIHVGELLYVREYIGKHNEFDKSHRDFHQLEVVFRCQLSDPKTVTLGTKKDKKQVGVEWIPLDELAGKRFLPDTIKPFFSGNNFNPKDIYLGDIN